MLGSSVITAQSVTASMLRLLQFAAAGGKAETKVQPESLRLVIAVSCSSPDGKPMYLVTFAELLRSPGAMLSPRWFKQVRLLMLLTQPGWIWDVVSMERQVK